MNINFSYQSEKTVCLKQNQEVIPKCGITENDGFFYFYCFNENTQKYRIKVFYDKYINLHLHWLDEYHSERIQQKLNDGSLYLYLRRLEKQAEKIVDSQVEKWAETDKEISVAKQTGNILEESGLMNNLIARAEEIMYPCLIYV